MSLFRTILVAGLALAGLMSVGCNQYVSRAKYEELSAQVVPLRDQVRQLQEENETLRADLVDKRRQIDSLLQLGNKRLELIPYTTSIELGGYTGAYSSDATQAAPDSIKIYLLPKDREGSVIKAGGRVHVKIFDLAAPEGQNLLGECSWSPEEVAKNWYSGLLSMTYHYSFVCPFKRLPQRPEVTVRVEFIDYFTGRHFTAVKVVNVPLPARLPTTTQPATAPPN